MDLVLLRSMYKIYLRISHFAGNHAQDADQAQQRAGFLTPDGVKVIICLHLCEHPHHNVDWAKMERRQFCFFI